MVPKILKIITIFLFLLFPLHSVLSIEPLNVVINEIAWMGTINSYNDEWIELYNQSTLAVNLDGWILRADDETPKINLTGTISAKGFYLLERTDDNTIANVVANQIYTGPLNNGGEKLKLYDNSGNLIDSVDCSGGWFAGDNETKQTMERKKPEISGNDSQNWQTSQIPNGTPGAKNSSVSQELVPEPESQLETKIEPEPEPTPEPKPEPEAQPEIISQKKTEPKTYPAGIIISELLPSPEGPDEKEEWIEIKNLNNGEVDISGWKIQDTVGATKTYVFPENTKISPQGFLVLIRPVSKITLNNSDDALKLFQPNNNLIDEISYNKAPLGQSYNRIESNWVWSDNLTPGLENIIPKIAKKEPLATPSNTIRGEEKPLTIDLKKEGKAAIGEPFSKKPSPHFLIAILLAVFSGILILILKKKLKIYYNKNI